MPTVPSPQTVLDRECRDVERNAPHARDGLTPGARTTVGAAR